MLIHMSTMKDENRPFNPFPLEGGRLETALSEANGMRVIYQKCLCTLTYASPVEGEGNKEAIFQAMTRFHNLTFYVNSLDSR